MAALPANAATRNIITLSPTPKRTASDGRNSALADSVTSFVLGVSDTDVLSDQLLGTVMGSPVVRVGDPAGLLWTVDGLLKLSNSKVCRCALLS